MEYDKTIVDRICDTVVRAGSTFLPDKKNAYRLAIGRETNVQAKWVLSTVLENAVIAERNRCPLCDDTGIPHVLVEVGPDAVLTGRTLESIKEGIRHGLRQLPGRPWP